MHHRGASLTAAVITIAALASGCQSNSSASAPSPTPTPTVTSATPSPTPSAGAVYTSSVATWTLHPSGQGRTAAPHGCHGGPLEASQTRSERAALSEQAEQARLPEEATSD